MEWSRREALRLGVVGGGSLLYGLTGAGRAMAALPCPADAACEAHGMGEPLGPYRADRFSEWIPRFERPFEPLVERRGVDLGAGLDGYRIGMAQSTVEILPGRSTPVWTYDGLMPGASPSTTATPRI